MRRDVASVMSTPAVTLAADAPLDRALQAMEEAHVRHLVVTRPGQAPSMLTDRHLLEATGWLPSRIREMYQGAALMPRTLANLDLPEATLAAPSDDALAAVVVESVLHGLGAVVVIDEGAVVGVVTAIDLMRAGLEDDPSLGDRAIHECMTPALIHATPHTHLTSALEQMREGRLHHLPICGQAGLVGMVSERDILRGVGRGQGEAALLESVMTREVRTIERSAPLSEAVSAFVEARIGALPVTDGDELVGMVSVQDVLDHLMNGETPSTQV